MSLEDKFYPEDGSYLNRFDNFMIKSLGKIGETYQHITGNSYRDLVNSCYKISVGGFTLGTLGFQPAAIILSLLSYSKAHSTKYESPLEEEIRLESQNNPRKGGKFCRTLSLAATPMILYLNYKLLDKGIKEGEKLVVYSGFGGLIMCASLIPYAFAEYLTKANVPKPPEKTILERAKEKIMSLVPQVRQPLPQPINYANNK